MALRASLRVVMVPDTVPEKVKAVAAAASGDEVELGFP